MSVRISTVKIQADNYLHLEELADSFEESLTFHAKKHKDFTCVIEKHLEANQIVIKTLYLEEYVN